MRLSISNLTWGDSRIEDMLPKLSVTGIHGIEIAPTAIWLDLNQVNLLQVKEMRDQIDSYGLRVSGLQSLLFGKPNFQLFSPSTWPAMKEHFNSVFRIANTLGTHVVVFGSPKNRLRGRLNQTEVDNLATEFFTSLIPSLEENDLVLTLEPNALEYGTDYLLTYSEVNYLSNMINSPRIAPQIDTGCLWMAGENPCDAFRVAPPHHIHISNPNLRPVPGNSNFTDFLNLVFSTEYRGWIVIETLGKSASKAIQSASWLSNELKRRL